GRARVRPPGRNPPDERRAHRREPLRRRPRAPSALPRERGAARRRTRRRPTLPRPSPRDAPALARRRDPMRRLLPLAALALAIAPSVACKAVSRLTDRDEHPIHAVALENAALYLDVAEREIEEGRTWRAIDRLVALRELEELAPETRLRSEALLDRAASIALERGRDDVDALEELWDLDLTPRMRALAGIRLA